MPVDETNLAVERAAGTTTIDPSDEPRIAAAITALEGTDSPVFSAKQKTVLAVHFAAFLDRCRGGGSLPPLGESASADVSETSLRTSRIVLETLSGAPTTTDEALLVAIHRDAALITRRSMQ